MLRCVRQLLVRPVGQTEEVRASYAAPSSPAAPGPELPVSLFVPANPQRAADQLQAYGQVTRMPPYASTSLAHSTPRPVAVGGNCYTTRLAKTCKTAVVLFSAEKLVFWGKALVFRFAKNMSFASLFFLQFCQPRPQILGVLGLEGVE